MNKTKSVILSIDQGTTSSRVVVVSPEADILFTAQEEFPQIYPEDGWVEHDPEAIWQSVLGPLKKAHAYTQDEGLSVSSIGISNQRETTVVWDRKTGKPIYNAIVWQDRRTAKTCRELKKDIGEDTVTEKTGLLLDPYFSATKLAWILDNVDGARGRTDELAFGTIDCFLISRLTDGGVHATDATNASRTNLFNIHTQDWDEALLEIFKVPRSVLPEVKDCSDNYGTLDSSILGEAIPICGVAGDQHAAAIGQACFERGTVKSTYGTGCFVMLNTGKECVASKARLLSTVLYRLDGKVTYALEGSIFIAGAAMQWLRDGLKILDDAKDSEKIARSIDSTDGVVMVPALTGLGAPHWDPDARGGIFGLTRGTERSHIIRAALESVCYQTYDLLHAMSEDGVTLKALRVDGGMVANDWLVQFLADTLDLDVDRPKVLETTALGAAFLAGLKSGIFKNLDDIAGRWQKDSAFNPDMTDETRAGNLKRWHWAVKKILSGQT